MGFLHLRLLSAPIALCVAALVPVHAFAQEGGAVQDFQLDPSRDPNRPKPPEREGPEVDNRPTPTLPGTQPAETAPPVAQPQIIPPPVIQPAPAPTATVAPSRTAPQREPASSTPVQTPPPPPTVAPEALAPAPQTQPPQAPVAQPTAQPASATPDGALPWLWIAIGLLVAGGLAAFLTLRRRASPAEAPMIDDPAEHTAAPVPASAPETAFTVPAPPMAVAAAPPPAARLSLEFEALEARTSIVAATIGYRLTIRNEGSVDAQDVIVAAVMANAEAKQEQTLARFFASPTDAPTHHIGRVGAGDWVEMKGELRLDHNAIVPIRVQDKVLFIPVLAFTAHYGWDEGHRGYSAAAFIVGQENDPPQERMAPFRLDLGPRQFKSIGSRLGQSALVT